MFQYYCPGFKFEIWPAFYIASCLAGQGGAYDCPICEAQVLAYRQIAHQAWRRSQACLNAVVKLFSCRVFQTVLATLRFEINFELLF